MPWIKTIPAREATGTLRETYHQIYSKYPPEYGAGVPTLVKPDGTEDSIIATHSLIPDLMKGIGQGYAALLQPHLPLTRRQQEMIATVVSGANRCFY
jgi:hypothetical protein